MAISKVIVFKHVDELSLDPANPRLGREARKRRLDQQQLLAQMSKWSLDELVDSFLSAGGFWTQDCLIAVKDQLLHESETSVSSAPPAECPESASNNKETLIVVEGNRRLAAIKLLYLFVCNKLSKPPRWLVDRAGDIKLGSDNAIFTQLPVLLAESRKDVEAYLGFRHVTGLKEWPPAEKAEFITGLIDDRGFSYRDVARQIGSRADVVRQNYIAFKMLLQMEENLDAAELENVEERFSVLFLSLRSEGTRNFLGVDTRAEPQAASRPVPDGKTEDLQEYRRWLFGTETARPVMRESRQIDQFGEILAEPRALEYLRANPTPSFDLAYSLTKASTDLLLGPLEDADRNIRIALSQMDNRAFEETVKEAAWLVIEGGIELAKRTKGNNLSRAVEALHAA